MLRMDEAGVDMSFSLPGAGMIAKWNGAIHGRRKEPEGFGGVGESGSEEDTRIRGYGCRPFVAMNILELGSREIPGTGSISPPFPEYASPFYVFITLQHTPPDVSEHMFDNWLPDSAKRQYRKPVLLQRGVTRSHSPFLRPLCLL